MSLTTQYEPSPFFFFLPLFFLFPFLFSVLQSKTNHARLQSETFSSMGAQMKGSATRLTRMAASGNKVAVLKLSAILIGLFLVLYYGLKMVF